MSWLINLVDKYKSFIKGIKEKSANSFILSLLLKLVFLLLLVIVSFLAFTNKSIPIAQNVYDKFNHILAFWTLTLFLDISFLSLRFSQKFAFMFFYGTFIEVVQIMLPHRHGSIGDLFSDMLAFLFYFYPFYMAEVHDRVLFELRKVYDKI